jgi:ABC-type polysaccharide/polyol phosphate transport system ATPase subunit
LRNWSEAVPVVRLEGITKFFQIERERATAYRSVQQRLAGLFHSRDTFYALRDIDLSVSVGEKIGIIGDNGSGKTTLLKIIAGLYTPSSGSLCIRGEMTLLAGLGIGMIADLTVRENVFLYGAVYGMSREQVKDSFCDIIEWAELEHFEDARLKTLSSGMKTRLAFSVTRHINKEIYLWDEALTAGDKHFQIKCQSVFLEHRRSAKTFLMTTHDLSFVRNFCDKALWLHKGRRMGFGDPERIVEQYQSQTRIGTDEPKVLARVL